MSTMLAQPEIIPPQSPLSPAEKSTLFDYDTHIRSASAAIRRSRCEIAYFGWRLKKANRWSEFNCSSEDEYRASRGISAYNWSICMIVGRLLEPLSLDELAAIGVDKAYALATVHADLWFDYPWLADAKRMSLTDLREVINVRNRTLDGGEASEALAVAESDNSVTKQRLEYLRKKYNLTANADAIAIALRDADSTVTLELAKSIRHANKLLTLTHQALRSKRGRTSNISKYEAEIHRLISKAQKRMVDALACAVDVK